MVILKNKNRNEGRIYRDSRNERNKKLSTAVVLSPSTSLLDQKQYRHLSLQLHYCTRQFIILHFMRYFITVLLVIFCCGDTANRRAQKR